MKPTALACTLAAASMGLASLSFAQGYEPRGPNGEAARAQQRHERHDQRSRMDHNRHDPNGRNDHRDWDSRDARHERQFGAHGPQFHRGGRIPMEYRHRQYVVNDWRQHHLKAPPRGHEWVQVGPDYALIVIASGVIVQLVLSP